MARLNKLLIANRGEIAVRIAATCRDLGIASVAVHSDVDAHALHVASCDEAVRLGGDTPATSYLRGDAVIAAARRVGADGIHPGFGFLAEQAAFAAAVMNAGLVWVGPRPDVIATMGDKIVAKEAMRTAGVALLPSVDLTGLDDDAVAAAAEDVGYPVMVKAAAGGGGKGMRAVDTAADLLDAVAAARRESANAFGDDRLFLERRVVRPRHVEVQIIGDEAGTVLHLGERDCSIQRRHQKVVEEAPAPSLSPSLVDDLRAAAVAAGEAIGYTNAGTVEFIVDAREDADVPFAFLEVNTRLQVEHPVTEEITGLDLVALQLDVAQGRPLPLTQDEVTLDGHAIEVRLYAENPANDYLPVTGTLRTFAPAAGVGVRWDRGVRQGESVSPYYDPMIAKVIGHGPTRDVAARRLVSALRRTRLLGIVTNRDLLVGILTDEVFLAGDVSTAFLQERFADPSTRMRRPTADEADLAALVAVLHPRVGRPGTVPAGFSNTGLGAESLGVTVAGERRRVEVDLGRDWRARVTTEAGDAGDARWQHVRVHDIASDRMTLEVDGHRLTALLANDGDDVQVVLPSANVTLRVDPRFPPSVVADEPGTSRAPMPGVVVEIAVTEGDQVSAGDLLAIVEAMKMEHRIVAEVDGTVSSVAVSAGDQLDADDVLVVIAAPEE